MNPCPVRVLSTMILGVGRYRNIGCGGKGLERFQIVGPDRFEAQATNEGVEVPDPSASLNHDRPFGSTGWKKGENRYLTILDLATEISRVSVLRSMELS